MRAGCGSCFAGAGGSGVIGVRAGPGAGETRARGVLGVATVEVGVGRGVDVFSLSVRVVDG